MTGAGTVSYLPLALFPTDCLWSPRPMGSATKEPLVPPRDPLGLPLKSHYERVWLPTQPSSSAQSTPILAADVVQMKICQRYGPHRGICEGFTTIAFRCVPRIALAVLCAQMLLVQEPAVNRVGPPICEVRMRMRTISLSVQLCMWECVQLCVQLCMWESMWEGRPFPHQGVRTTTSPAFLSNPGGGIGMPSSQKESALPGGPYAPTRLVPSSPPIAPKPQQRGGGLASSGCSRC